VASIHELQAPTIIRRVSRRMALLRMTDADNYIAYLKQNPQELANLHGDPDPRHAVLQGARVVRRNRERRAAGHRAPTRPPSSHLGRGLLDG
jgi:hypothetical protein